MPENTMEALPRVGCDMLHAAKLLTDTAEGVTYDTSVALKNVKTIGFRPSSSISTFNADDGPRVVYAQVGEEVVSIEVADLLPKEYALLTGANYNKGLVSVGNPTPPDFAVMWRSQKSNGKYRYLRVLKTKFGVPDTEYRTKETSPEFQTQTIEGRNALRVFDDLGFEYVDEDSSDLDESVTGDVLKTEWFKDPMFDPTKPYSAEP